MTLTSFAQPANDDCSNAEVLTISTDDNVTVNFNLSSVNIEDNQIYCSSSSTYASADVWYQFELPFDGSIIINSTYSNLNFYNLFDACGGTMICPAEGGWFPNLTANTVYLLRVLRLQNFLTGNPQFTIRAFQRAINDTCDTAETITVTTNSTPVFFVIAGAFLNYEEYCSGLFADIIDIWYAFTMPIDGDILIGSGGDNSFALYDTCNDTPIYCNVEMGGIYQNLTAGSTYKLRVFRSSSYSDEIPNELFRISIDPTLGISDELLNDIKIYPNPATETINIASAFPLDKIEIYDILGQQITTAYHNNVVNVEKFSAGVYFLKVYTPEGFVLKRIVKK
ncbi:T9SS type A sorting domain-containing protein [Gelidibacter algens]|nr:T9SS type A sorting domain-containing protein [Gelidibacter algens]